VLVAGCDPSQWHLAVGGHRQSADRCFDRRGMRGNHDRHPPAGKDSVRTWYAMAMLLSCAFASCGYHTAGHVSTLPSNIQTIAIPAFVNQTQTYRIEQILTRAVVKELITRTRYHIVND